MKMKSGTNELWMSGKAKDIREQLQTWVREAASPHMLFKDWLSLQCEYGYTRREYFH